MFGNPTWTNPFDQAVPQGGGFGGVPASTVGQSPSPGDQPLNSGFGGAPVQPAAPVQQPAAAVQPAAPVQPAADAMWGRPTAPEMPPASGAPPVQPGGFWGNQSSQPNEPSHQPSHQLSHQPSHQASHQPSQLNQVLNQPSPNQPPNLYQRHFNAGGSDFPVTQAPQELQFQAPAMQFQGTPASAQPQRFETFEAPAAPGSMGLPPQQQFGSPYQPAPFAQPSQMSQAMYGNQAGNLSVAPLNQMQQLPPQSNLYAQPPFSQPPGLPMDGPLAPDANARLCTCGEPALLLNVKKEGPNQGRPFFKCAKQHPDQPCSFFEWADEPPRGASNVTQGGAPQAQQAGPNCRCGQATLILTVKKDGPNQGRTFYKCAQGQCGFFQWADQEPEPPGPPCSCGVPSVRKTVSKEGPNRGRPFMACATRGCDFFQWADEEASRGGGAPMPTPARAGGMARSREGDVCFHCNQPGHWAGSCPNKAAGFKGRGKGRGRGRGRKKAAAEDDFCDFPNDDRFMPY